MDPNLLLTALEGAGAGIVVADREGTIQWINAEFSRMTGYSSEDVVGKSPRVLKSGTHDQSFYADLWRTILSGSAWHGEIVNRRKDGSLYTEEQRITPVFSEHREVTHFIGIKWDISARKRMEEELRESKERYQSLIDGLGEGIVSLDRQRRVLMANPAAENIFGVPRGGAIGKELTEFVDPGDIPMLAGEAARRQRGERSTFEARVIRPDGERRTLQVSAAPQYDSHGQFQGSLGVIRDITEEKRLLQRLKLLAHTLDSVDECVSICDPDDRLLFVNRAFLRTYGYEECNLIGENVSIVRSPLNPPEVTGGILSATLAGGWRGELWNRKRDGTDFLVMLNSAAVTDGNGRVDATVGVARDITESKRAELELTRARDHAESANRAKSEFLATMSHEIRTPMNGVIGMTGLLLDTQLTPEQRDYAETVRNSGDALLTVINDILDFSKIEAGRLSIECFSFDLRLVLEEVNEMLAPKAEEHDLELVLEYPSSLPRHFIGDAGRIRQVITNLVGNAIKFTPAGSVRVTVECAGQDTQTAQMRVAVQDTGVGIPQDKLDSLFAKFSQVDSSITRRYGGTGLGLAIAKQLAELMSGSVAVESRLGEGSKFSLTLPLRQDAEPRAEANVAEPRIAGLGAAWAGFFAGLGLRVLVAEDNAVNQKVAVRMLEKLGLRTDLASNGREAVELREMLPYDLILMDCQMPEMDGYEAARAIRRWEGGTRRTAIVAMTAEAMTGAREKCIDAGMDDYIAKPVTLEDLVKALQKWLPERK
jgi:PAS domain S-box-containing protein